MNNKFLDKVCDQIISETRIIDDKIQPPFPFPHFLQTLPLFLLNYSYPPLIHFSKHCKNIYGLNKEEIEYVWGKYKKGITTLITKTK
jgi:hypothetical protein